MSQKDNETVMDLTGILRSDYADPSCGCCSTGENDPELEAEFDLWLHNLRMEFFRKGWNARAEECMPSTVTHTEEGMACQNGNEPVAEPALDGGPIHINGSPSNSTASLDGEQE